MYQRNGSPETSTWKTTQDEFRGYVRAKLEDMEKDNEDMWKAHRSCQKRMIERTEENKESIHKIKVTSARNGAITGGIIGLAVSLLRWFI